MSTINLYKNLPKTSGVYLMKDARDRILYIGKAANLKRRVSSYFLRAHDSRIEALVDRIRKIDFIKTDTALEALILESRLIKKHQPPFNVLEKDDKSFLYLEITKEKFPRVLLVRGKDEANGWRFGPFVSGGSAREALRLIRKIFPYSTHTPEEVAKFIPKPKSLVWGLEVGKTKPCFNYSIGLCPGICTGAASRADYLKNIRNIKLFFSGKKKVVVKNLIKHMKEASKNKEFEKAGKLRNQIFALKHIQDTALIGGENSFNIPPMSHVANYMSLPHRIEGYDISNISGTSATGSMVVFAGGKPARQEYRKFRIRTVRGSNDVAMLREVLERRLERKEWPLPAMILVDGGLPQVHAAEEVLRRFGIKISVIGMAKGPARDKNEFINAVPRWTNEAILIRVRDEAHRFAVAYHKKLRSRYFLSDFTK